MNVSIIIVNYNTKELILNCINSVIEKTIDIEYEIIVVDNNSTDGSRQMIIENFPSIKLIELTENIGFGKANNEGVKHSIGNYLFFLNSDTKLLNNAVKIFFDFMELNNTDHKIGALGCFLLDENLKICHSYGQFPNPFKYLVHTLKSYFSTSILFNESKYFDKNDLFFEVDYITGADLFVSSKVFKNLNGFDKNYFMYYEETDLQYQMRLVNLNRLIIKGPEILHYENSSFLYVKNKSNKRRIFLDTSQFYYYKKNYPNLTYLFFRALYIPIRFISILDNSYSIKERRSYLENLFKNT